jgi:hypothetical protein
MAIEIEYSTKFGDDYYAAYARVINIKIDYVDQIAQVYVGIYKDESARNKKLQPVEIEEHRYSGEEFQNLFAEILADKEGPSISPIRNVYEDLVTKEGNKYDKYTDGEKVFDTDFDTGSEIGKEETLRKAEAAVEATRQAVTDAEQDYQTGAESKETTSEQLAALQAAVDNANDAAKEAEAAYKRLLAAEETEDDKVLLK